MIWGILKISLTISFQTAMYLPVHNHISVAVESSGNGNMSGVKSCIPHMFSGCSV